MLTINMKYLIQHGYSDRMNPRPLGPDRNGVFHCNLASTGSGHRKARFVQRLMWPPLPTEKHAGQARRVCTGGANLSGMPSLLSSRLQDKPKSGLNKSLWHL